MTLVDDRGRLFGRWNVVDALIGVVLLGAIPLLYGGYALFRPQPASLTAVEPARIQAPGNMDVTIRGTNIRPYMRVSFDGNQGRTFLFANATTAVVRVQDIPPGVYDVILYDNAQERARLPKAFEVIAPPVAQAQVELAGTFTAIAESIAAQIKPDLAINGLGTVLRVGQPQPSVTRAVTGPAELLAVPSTAAINLPVLIRANCTLVQRSGAAFCMALDNTLIRDTMLNVPLNGANAMLQIDQVRPVGSGGTADVRVRLSGERAVVERVHQGDQDVERDNEFTTGATIVSVSGVTRASANVIVTAMQQGAPTITAGDIATLEAVMRVPVQQSGEGWSYRGAALKPGRTFMFRTRGWELSGTVLSVTAK